MPLPDLADKVVIITGAGSGIGRATALKLCKLGCVLALSDIDLESLSETASLCSSIPDHRRIITSRFSVANDDECREGVKTAMKWCGRIDGVFNCAGVNPTYTEIEDCSDLYWNRLMDVNVKGGLPRCAASTFQMTRAAVPHMKAGAAFVNVSSIYGLKPGAGFAAYCATKYAVVGFSKSMALELGSKGIRVNVIAPGYIDTPTNASVVEGREAMERSARNTALKRLGTPDEIADVVAFLLSDDSRYMTGSVVEVDGGMA